MRYLLSFSVGTNPMSDTFVKHSATSPSINLNPNSTSNALLLSCAAESSVRRSTPEGPVGPPRAKTNNFANANSQSSPNKREAPPTTVQNLSSKFSKLEKLFTDEIAAYTNCTVGIHSQYFFLYDKVRQLEAGNSETIIWKIPVSDVCIRLRKSSATII